MPRRKTTFVQGHYYHINNRGANRNNIFFSKENYLYCLRLMKKYLGDNCIAVIAYCLMPNHYYLLLRPDGDISLSDAVGGLFKAYVMAMNNQTGHSGTLFEGRFQDVHVDNDGYLLHLCRYIYANPVKAGLVLDPKDWVYSNYLEWVGERQGTLVDMDFVADLRQGLS